MEFVLEPKLLTGKITKISDMGVRIELKGKMGIVNLPNRSVFADTALAENDEVEMYISYARVVNKGS